MFDDLPDCSSLRDSELSGAKAGSCVRIEQLAPILGEFRIGVLSGTHRKQVQESHPPQQFSTESCVSVTLRKKTQRPVHRESMGRRPASGHVEGQSSCITSHRRDHPEISVVSGIGLKNAIQEFHLVKERAFVQQGGSLKGGSP